MSKRGTNGEVLKTVISWTVVSVSLITIAMIAEVPGVDAKNAIASRSSAAPIKIATTSNRINESTELDTAKPADTEAEEERNKEQLVVARVISVRTKSKKALEPGAPQNRGIPEVQRVKAMIMEGRLKGSELDLTNELSENPTSNIYVKPGQELVLA